MRSAIEIFCSRVVFRQRFFRKNNEMADEYDANAGGNRGSLLTVILANVLWTLRLQELVKQRVLWNVYASVFSRLSVTEWVDVESDLSLQTSELVWVLFAFCSMTPVPTTMATLCLHLWSIIDSLKLISTLRLSIQTVGQASEFVQPWMGDSVTTHSTVEHVFDMVAVIPTSQIRWDLSRIQLIWIDLFAFYCVWLLYNKTVFIWHVYYNKIQHTSGGPVKFISTQYTCVTNFYHFTQPYICYFINIQSRQWTRHAAE